MRYELVTEPPSGVGTMKRATPPLTIWLEPGLMRVCDHPENVPDEKSSENTVEALTHREK